MPDLGLNATVRPELSVVERRNYSNADPMGIVRSSTHLSTEIIAPGEGAVHGGSPTHGGERGFGRAAARML